MNKVLLMILDGWGVTKNPSVSAISKAKTPFIDHCYRNYSNSRIISSGLNVGLPKNQVGNSEVGHMNIGAGRIINQDIIEINKSIKNKSLENNYNLNRGIIYSINNNKNTHIIGLLSDGGVHSHINHLFHIIDILLSKNIKNNIYIHVFTDGRDVNPKTSKKYIKLLSNYINNKPVYIATIIGRYYAMDRNNRLDKTFMSYNLMVNGIGKLTDNPLDIIDKYYDNNITDEFIKPIIINNKNFSSKIKNGDLVICFNYRSDRMRQIVKVLTQQNFLKYNMKKLDLYFITMTVYNKKFKNIFTIFNKKKIINTLGEVLESENKFQLRIAETEKYPHVTFFFSGGREKPFKKETRILCPSPNVFTYDLKPEMSIKNISNNVINELIKNKFHFICLNFANPDMVGHTGSMSATIKACEYIDKYSGNVSFIALKNNYTIIITSDHGNADYMINKDGTPNTSHTIQPVPFFILNNNKKFIKLKNGNLSDIAPTILKIMNIKKPKEMTGIPLF